MASSILLAGLVTLAAVESPGVCQNTDKEALHTSITAALQNLGKMEHLLNRYNNEVHDIPNDQVFKSIPIIIYRECVTSMGERCTEEKDELLTKCFQNETDHIVRQEQTAYDTAVRQPWEEKFGSLRKALENPDSNEEDLTQAVQTLDTSTSVGKSFKDSFEKALIEELTQLETTLAEIGRDDGHNQPMLRKCMEKVFPDVVPPVEKPR